MALSIIQIQAQDSTNIDFLRQGGYVLFFRHASAPGGTPPAGTGSDNGGSIESQWWKSCDVNVARQLSTQGRTEAITIGKAFKAKSIRVGKLLTSEFCRAYESAVLMNVNATLQFSTAATFTIYPAADRAVGVDAIAREIPAAGTNTVVWTHGESVGEYPLGGLGWSDAIVYRPRAGGGKPDLIGYVRAATWGKVLTSIVFSSPSPNNLVELTVTPNPAFDKLLIRSANKHSVVVFNALGQEVFTDATMADARTIDIASWANTAYTVVISSGTERVSKQFVKR